MTEYNSILVYGFKEQDDDVFISYNIIKDNGLELYTTKIINEYATDIIYGLPITLKEINIKCSNKIDVDNFIILNNLDIIPELFVCINGPFAINKSEYDLFE
jgi:hypothetical protein